MATAGRAKYPTKLGLLILIISVICHQVQGDCGALTTVNNGSPDSNAATSPHGTVVTYTCITGYEIASVSSSTHSITCQSDDQWEPIPHCQRVNCPALPTNADTTLLNDGHEFEDQVTMSCNAPANFRIPGWPVNTVLIFDCFANKTWSTEPPVSGCIGIECDFPIDDHSTGPPLEPRSRGDVVQFDCNEGYFFKNDATSNTFSCNNEGLWEKNFNGVIGDTDWECLAKQCSDLITTYAMANVHLSTNERMVGQEVKLSCNQGYEYNDSSIEKFTTCFGNETWSYEPEGCVPKLCPPVFNITYANLSTTDHYFGITVNYSCFPGYFFPDESTWRLSSCNKYGKWSVSISQCSDTLPELPNSESVEVSPKSANTIAMVSLVIVIILLLAIIIFDAVTIGKHIDQLQTNCGSRFECCRDIEEYEDEESLDGDITKSSLSLGYGRVTPAASTVDLQASERSMSAIVASNAGLAVDTGDEVQLVNEELQTVEINTNRNGIPRTRLKSAKASVVRAINSVKIINQFTRSLKGKANYNTEALPLGAQNYGKPQEIRPPSPIKDDGDDDDDDDDSEYTDDDSEEEV